MNSKWSKQIDSVQKISEINESSLLLGQKGLQLLFIVFSGGTTTCYFSFFL